MALKHTPTVRIERPDSRRSKIGFRIHFIDVRAQASLKDLLSEQGCTSCENMRRTCIMAGPFPLDLVLAGNSLQSHGSASTALSSAGKCWKFIEDGHERPQFFTEIS